MRLWYFSTSVNSFFKRACTAIHPKLKPNLINCLKKERTSDLVHVDIANYMHPSPKM